MRQLTIISGKGGTGKTTLATNFVKLATEHIAVDCDVDASNLHIVFNPKVEKRVEFVGGAVATVTGNCINCGKCEELCRFEAISDSETNIKISSAKCEGCGVCQYVCPTSAIELKSSRQGEYFISSTEFCPLVHARLNPGAENSGLLVTTVRNVAEDLAIQQHKKVIIIDGAPGIGCPVISSLTGVDYVLIVTEPTISGISDFLRVFEVAKFLGVKTLVCINKYNLNLENTSKICSICAENEILLVGKIPYDERVPVYLSKRKFVVDDPESNAGKEILSVWDTLKHCLYQD